MFSVENRVPQKLGTAMPKAWSLCARPWKQQHIISQNTHPLSPSPRPPAPLPGYGVSPLPSTPSHSVRSVAKAFLLQRRRLRFDPDKKLYFPYEPGKQATSAVRITNVSRSGVAFKFQTTAPKSCFMRPPSGVLSPGESIVATVVKFIEHPERSQRKQTKDKFKIVSLKLREGIEFTPEIFEEQQELVAVEQILRVHFLDPQHPTTELDKLKTRLIEADAANEARKKPLTLEEPQRQLIGEGNVLEEWNKMKLARQLAKEDSE